MKFSEKKKKEDEKTNEQIDILQKELEKTPPVKTKQRPKNKFGPKKQVRVRFCKKCNDTSFISIPDGKCYRCGADF